MVARLFAAVWAMALGCSFAGPPADVVDADGGNGESVSVSFRFDDTYQSTTDTEIDESNPGDDRSDLDEMRFDESTGGGGPTEAVMALIRFDDIFGEGAGQIPAAATPTSATLTVTVVNDGGPGAVCDMLTAWSSTTSWDSFGFGGPDSGADFVPTAVATAPAQLGVQQINVLSSIQSWHQGELANEGWLFFPQSRMGVTLATSEAANLEDRPLLTVEYTLP